MHIVNYHEIVIYPKDGLDVIFTDLFIKTVFDQKNKIISQSIANGFKRQNWFDLNKIELKMSDLFGFITPNSEYITRDSRLKVILENKGVTFDADTEVHLYKAIEDEVSESYARHEGIQFDKDACNSLSKYLESTKCKILCQTIDENIKVWSIGNSSTGGYNSIDTVYELFEKLFEIYPNIISLKTSHKSFEQVIVDKLLSLRPIIIKSDAKECNLIVL